MLERGSEWRRWDLHVHTPETILNDQFGSWDEYLTAIESQPSVKVLGITDYMSISNYSKVKQFKAKERLPNIDLVIPNIEFRIAPPSDKATAINIHIIISPDDPNHEQEILNALGRLTWVYNKRNYSCLPAQLTALGKAFDPKIRDDRAALETGVNQFKIDFSALREWYEGEHWLRHNSLTAVAAGKDGLSGFRRDGAWAAHRDEITRFSQILFSSRPGERDFWLCRGSVRDRETVAHLSGPKPCIHGSDAHALNKLFRPDEDRFCWIKADTTFNGLRQVLYEPEDRVYIGPTAPIYHDQARVIRSVKITNSGEWFEEVDLPLNAGLVSIIGQKGSGKSALAEIISYAAGSWHDDDQTSFLRRAGRHLEDLEIELEWGDGTKSEARLWANASGEGEVRYLSQKFVERLCAEDQLGTELINEIEAVIFAYIDPTDTLNASSFEELRALRTEGVRREADALRSGVSKLIREECGLREHAGRVPEKRAQLKMLTEERIGLEKQMPAASSPEEARLEQELSAARQALNSTQQAAGVDKQALQKVADIRSRVSAFKTQMERFHAELREQLKQAGVPEVDHAAFRPEFPGDTEAPLARLTMVLQRSIARKMGDAEKPAEGTIRAIQKKIQALETRHTADKARQEKIKIIQTRIAWIGAELEKINREIALIEGPERERISSAREECWDYYIGYFECLRDEQRILEELYEPVKAKLDSGSGSEQELEFAIRWVADLKYWLERGGVLFDQRKTIPYGTMLELGAAAEKILEPAWTSGDPDQIRTALGEFLEPFRSIATSKYLRSGVSFRDLLEWLFATDHIKLSYGLKYNGVELEKLSPGTKGIVLLILYLGLDVDDTRPLIVDQPDENLDNESIYKLLTTYFRLAKRRRQILLITHNPNLVVNADSEQVIIAQCGRRETGLPHIAYCSGALEDTRRQGDGIREQVCRILEGGSDAFMKRERRYAIGGQPD